MSVRDVVQAAAGALGGEATYVEDVFSTHLYTGNGGVQVIENGIDGPLPGTILKRCSNEVNDLVRQSDLIISKGGGNFDTLDEERKLLKNKISYLLLSKCDPQYKTFGVKLIQPILANL